MVLFKLGMEIEFVHGARLAWPRLVLPVLTVYPWSWYCYRLRVPRNEFAHCTKMFNPILFAAIVWLGEEGRDKGPAGTVTRCWGYSALTYRVLFTGYGVPTIISDTLDMPTPAALASVFYRPGQPVGYPDTPGTRTGTRAGVRLFTFRVRACQPASPRALVRFVSVLLSL